MLGDPQTATPAALGDAPEPIPLRQAQINAQADAAIRELFPRIPNTDRQMIIDRAFRKVSQLSLCLLCAEARLWTEMKRAMFRTITFRAPCFKATTLLG